MALSGSGLYFETHGQGLPCLAIHGGLGVDHTYMRTLSPLEDLLRITYYDQRGNGRSDRSAVHALTMEGLADDAAALIAETAGGPAVVIGHSYGGFVAQEMAIRHPSSVRALVLIDTTPGQLGTGEVPPADGPPLPQEAIEMMAQQPESDEQFAQQFARLFPLLYLKTLSADEAAPRLAGTVYSAAAMARGFEVLAGWSSVDRLGSISAPTLLMWGSEDLVCSLPQAGRIQSRIAGSELVVFDGVGHFPWWEAPDPFFQALRAWLSRL